jgi:putative salt-induced outer membrane protein YdiY
MYGLRRNLGVMALVLGALGVHAPNLEAQDDKELGWFFTTEFTAVWTAGNSVTNTFGLDAKVRRAWDRTELTLSGGGIRSENTKRTRTAVGTPDNFNVTETTDREKTAESFYARGRLDYSISPKFFTFSGADWQRNTFAGVDSRTLFALGAGNTWVESALVKFKSDYSFTYTFQQDVVENPFFKTSFPGVRLQFDLAWKPTGSTEFTSDFIGDWMFSKDADAPANDLEEGQDLRVDFTNALSVAISSKLALKPSWQILWRNDPALTEVPLFDTGGTDTGETVLVPLQRLDSVFKLALVVNF